MKKALVAVAVLVMLIAFLPVVGNSYMQEYVQKKLFELENRGLHLQKQEHQNDYILTRNRYIFEIQDAQKLFSPLNDVPKSVTEVLQNARVTLDVLYKNLPFARVVSFEITPLSLNPKIYQRLQKKDPHFAQQLHNFFDAHALVYHVDYNLLNASYKGFVQDITQDFVLKNDTNISLELSAWRFGGKGNLFKPSQRYSNVDLFELVLQQQKSSISLLIKKFALEEELHDNMTQKLLYKKFHFHVDDEESNTTLNISMNTMKATTKRVEKNGLLQIENEVQAEKLVFEDKTHQILLKGIVFDANISNLNIKRLQELESDAMKLLKKDNTALQHAVRSLANTNIEIDIRQLAVEHILFNHKDLDFFSLQSFSQFPTFETNSSIRLSSPLYNALLEHVSNTQLLDDFAIKTPHDVRFDILYHNKHLVVNTKKVL